MPWPRQRIIRSLTFSCFAFLLAVLLKAVGQVKLENVIVPDGIEVRKIGVAAAGSQIVIDSVGVTVAERADDAVAETVSQGREHAFEIAAALEKVRIQQIYVQRVLFDVLPVGACFPGVLLRGLAIDQSRIANSNASLPGQPFVGLSVRQSGRSGRCSRPIVAPNVISDIAEH